jgi:hypothetical protein
MWWASKSDLVSLELELAQINAWGEFSWGLLDWVVVRRRWEQTTTTAEATIPLNTTSITSPSLKVPFAAVEVTEMKKPFGWYVGIWSKWRNFGVSMGMSMK